MSIVQKKKNWEMKNLIENWDHMKLAVKWLSEIIENGSLCGRAGFIVQAKDCGRWFLR